jgi:hypothetical protein
MGIIFKDGGITVELLLLLDFYIYKLLRQLWVSYAAYEKSKPLNDAGYCNAKYAMSRSSSLLLMSIGLLMFRSILSYPYHS